VYPPALRNTTVAPRRHGCFLDADRLLPYLSFAMESIPVRLHTPDAVFTESFGLLSLQEGCLVLEYESKDAFIGAYSSGVGELQIFPDDVSTIEFKKGLTKATLTIRAKSMKLFEKVPGAKLGALTLRIKRKHKAMAEQLALFLQHRLAELESDVMSTPAPILDTGDPDPKSDWN